MVNNNQITLNKKASKIVQRSSFTRLKEVKDSTEMIAILNGHNFFPKNEPLFRNYLEENGYYFTTGYRRPVLDSFSAKSWSGRYETGLSENFFYEIAEFDKKFSILLLKYSNIIERRIKTRTAFFVSKQLSESFYLDCQNFSSYERWVEFINKIYLEVLRDGLKNNNPVIHHHILKYNQILPAWALFEHLSFGQFIKLITNLNVQHKVNLLKDVYVSSKTHYDVKSYMSNASAHRLLDAVCHIRNRIAHLGRIYDWKFVFLINSSLTIQSSFLSVVDLNKGYLNIVDIMEVFGLFIPKVEYIQMKSEYSILLDRLSNSIQEPYYSRIKMLICE